MRTSQLMVAAAVVSVSAAVFQVNQALTQNPAPQVFFSATGCTMLWSPNTESDLAGYRAWASKAGVRKPDVVVPVGTAPSTTCAALGVDSDGLWDFNVLAFDNAVPPNASATSSVQATRDTVAPDTSVTQSTAGGTVSFVLTSNETGVTFDCALDGAPLAGCTTPKQYTGLTDGPHTFVARAKDRAGNVDASVASVSWVANITPPAQPSGLSITANP